MTKSIAIKSAFSCGGKAWDYLEHISCKNVVLIRDSQMSQGVSNIVSKIRTYMDSMGVIMGEYDIGGDKLILIQYCFVNRSSNNSIHFSFLSHLYNK